MMDSLCELGQLMRLILLGEHALVLRTSRQKWYY